MILRRDTSLALSKARADLAAMATAIAELAAKRDAALTADADIDAVAALDDEAHKQGNRLRALQDKISLLEGRLAGEQAQQRVADYKAWAAKVEAALPACRAADEEYERAKMVYAAAIKRIMLSREAALRVYLESDFQPPETVFVAYYLSLEPLGSDILETWQIERGYADRRPPQPSEYLRRGADISPRGYAAAMRSRLDELSVAIKTAHDPAPAEPETEEAVA